MSDNIGKPLFECSQTWAWFRGLVEGETDKTYLVRTPGSKTTRRVRKTTQDVLLAVGSDYDAAGQRYREAIRSFDDKVREALAALAAIKHQQKQAAIDALKAVSP